MKQKILADRNKADNTFEALGLIILPDGREYRFGTPENLIPYEELFDPYLYQRCSHKDSLRKLLREHRDELPLSREIAYLPDIYHLATALTIEHTIVLTNQSKVSQVQWVHLYMNKSITKAQYHQLLNYEILLNQCDIVSVQCVDEEFNTKERLFEDFETFIENNIEIENSKVKKK